MQLEMAENPCFSRLALHSYLLRIGRYSGPDTGQPYQENFGPHALILATDHEDETGYLVLFDATRLYNSMLEQYAHYRQAQAKAGQTQIFPHLPPSLP